MNLNEQLILVGLINVLKLSRFIVPIQYLVLELDGDCTWKTHIIQKLY